MTDSSVTLQCLRDSAQFPFLSLSNCYEIKWSKQGGCKVTLLPLCWNWAATEWFSCAFSAGPYINPGGTPALSIWHFLGAVFHQIFSLVIFSWQLKVSRLNPKTFLQGRGGKLYLLMLQTLCIHFVWSYYRPLCLEKMSPMGKKKAPRQKEVEDLATLITNLLTKILGMTCKRGRRRWNSWGDGISNHR